MTSESNTIINQVNLEYVESLKDLFTKKAEKMKNLTIKLDNETKLKFYGLYKVATVGKITDNNQMSVSMFDFTEKYKKY
jgi:acyl-CoA-binding protein